MKRKSAPTNREIVRYGNRKLYDLRDRKYVTLEELARSVSAGDEISVRDQKTGEDLTMVVMGQILVDTLRRRTTSLPQRILPRLIRIASATEEAPPAPPDVPSRLRDEAERIAADLIHRGRLGLEDAAALRQSIVQSASRAVADAQGSIERRLHELVEMSEREFGVTPSLTRLKERLLAFETHLPSSAAKKPRGASRRRGRTKSA